jgi:hypothetical protein
MLTNTDKSRIADEIVSVVKNFMDPHTLNYETHIGLRANVEGYVMAGDGQIAFSDYPSYKEAMKTNFETFKCFAELQLTKCFVYVLSEDAASCTVEFKGKLQMLDDQEMPHNGCWTFVFKKFENDWKVIHENGTHTH